MNKGEEKILKRLADKSAFDSFCNEHKELWFESLVWKESQKDLLRDILENDVSDFSGYNAIPEKVIEKRLKENTNK